MPRFEAASISIRLNAWPSLNISQEEQALQGTEGNPPPPELWRTLNAAAKFPSGILDAFAQFTAFAINRAGVVLTMPRGPEKREAWATRPVSICLWSTRTI